MKLCIVRDIALWILMVFITTPMLAQQETGKDSLKPYIRIDTSGNDRVPSLNQKSMIHRGDVAYCSAYLTNYTDYTLDVIINDEWWGTISAYSEGYITLEENKEYTLLLRSSDQKFSLGPRQVTCNDFFYNGLNLYDPE